MQHERQVNVPQRQTLICEGQESWTNGPWSLSCFLQGSPVWWSPLVWSIHPRLWGLLSACLTSPLFSPPVPGFYINHLLQSPYLRSWFGKTLPRRHWFLSLRLCFLCSALRAANISTQGKHHQKGSICWAPTMCLARCRGGKMCNCKETFLLMVLA